MHVLGGRGAGLAIGDFAEAADPPEQLSPCGLSIGGGQHGWEDAEQLEVPVQLTPCHPRMVVLEKAPDLAQRRQGLGLDRRESSELDAGAVHELGIGRDRMTLETLERALRAENSMQAKTEISDAIKVIRGGKPKD